MLRFATNTILSFCTFFVVKCCGLLPILTVFDYKTMSIKIIDYSLEMDIDRLAL